VAGVAANWELEKGQSPVRAETKRELGDLITTHQGTIQGLATPGPSRPLFDKTNLSFSIALKANQVRGAEDKLMSERVRANWP